MPSSRVQPDAILIAPTDTTQLDRAAAPGA
jgi:hypothetical protein